MTMFLEGVSNRSSHGLRARWTWLTFSRCRGQPAPDPTGGTRRTPPQLLPRHGPGKANSCSPSLPISQDDLLNVWERSLGEKRGRATGFFWVPETSTYGSSDQSNKCWFLITLKESNWYKTILLQDQIPLQWCSLFHTHTCSITCVSSIRHPPCPTSRGPAGTASSWG